MKRFCFEDSKLGNLFWGLYFQLYIKCVSVYLWGLLGLDGRVPRSSSSQPGKCFTSGIPSADEGMLQAAQQIRRALKEGAVSRAAWWQCESDEVSTFPSVRWNQRRCLAACPETSTRSNNRGTYCWWLRTRQPVFPLSLPTELLLPAVPRLAFFLPTCPQS